VATHPERRGDSRVPATAAMSELSTLALDMEKASALSREEKAKGTRKLYGVDFRIFTE
jgi:hypothetical protein